MFSNGRLGLPGCVYINIYIYIWLSILHIHHIQRLHCRFVASLFFVQKKTSKTKKVTQHPNSSPHPSRRRRHLDPSSDSSKRSKSSKRRVPALPKWGGRHQWGGMGPTLGEHYSLSQGWAQKTIYKYLENIGTYHLLRQLWLLLGVKLMEINSNLFSRYGLYNFTFWGGFFPRCPVICRPWK